MTLPLRKSSEDLRSDTDSNAKQNPVTEVTPSLANQVREVDIRNEQPRLVPAEAGDTARVSGETARRDLVEAQGTATPEMTPLFPSDDLQQFQRRWDQIQTAFVDQPREAVHDADQLVSSAIGRLGDVFSSERSKLDERWERGENASTEDMRVALQRYRSFFRRILAV